MPVPHTPIPSFLPPLHIYRHLLREASYLPPAWRGTVTDTVRHRFRRNQVKDAEKSDARRAGAYKVLCTLRAANSGDMKAMESLILKGFGRRGLRRRQLLVPLVHSGSLENAQALESLLNQEAGPQGDAADGKTETKPGKKRKSRTNAFYHKWDTDKLKQLLRSQRMVQKNNPDIWHTRSVKVLDENQFVPSKTTWGKPPGKKLVETKRAKWWRLVADKTMPPLGHGEWDLLGRLSNGVQELDDWKIPERRTLAQSQHQDTQTNQQDWNWESYASKPVADAERTRSFQAVRRTGEKDPGPYAPQRTVKELSDRWYRRMYNRVWQMSPKMDQDPKSLKYSFAWGTPKSGLVPPTKTQLEMFKEIDRKDPNATDP